MMKPDRLKKTVARVDDLPTLPNTILRITEAVNNPKSSARDLARIVNEDQVLTARLLRLVNSSFYGFPQRISTVTGAVVLLGFDAVRNLLLTTTLSEVFGARIRNNSGQDELWDHSLGCALGARTIAQRLGYEETEESFVSGLLHDIGKVVEALFMPEEFEEILTMVDNKKMLLVDAEEEVLGYTHQEVGVLLADKWNLPERLQEVIGWHHSPTKAGKYPREVGIVHAADILVRALEIGSGGDDRIPPLDFEAWEGLGFNLDEIDSVMEEIEEEFGDLRGILN